MNFLPQYINGGPDLSYWSFLGELKIPIDDHEADERLHKSAAKSVSASTTIDCLNRQPIIIVRQTMHNCIFKHLYWKGMFRQKVSVVFHSFSWFKKEIDTSFHELSVRANRLTDNRRYGNNDRLPLSPDCTADQPACLFHESSFITECRSVNHRIS